MSQEGTHASHSRHSNNQNYQHQQYKRISWGEIKHVQNLIERCIQRYMSQSFSLAIWKRPREELAEIISALQIEANIEPGFTCLVWQKLEEQNPSFFYTYNFLLRLKDQILAFNYLVRHQNSAEERYQQEKAVEGDSKTVDLGVLLSPTVVKNPLEKAWDADAPKG